MPRRKKRFSCGHKGFGRFCHRCRKREEQRASVRVERKQRKEARKNKKREHPFDVEAFPPKVAKKALSIIQQIRQGCSYTGFYGKPLTVQPDLISVPVSRSYRLLFKKTEHGLGFHKLMSHEDYNAAYKRL